MTCCCAEGGSFTASGVQHAASKENEKKETKLAGEMHDKLNLWITSCQ